MRLRTRVTISFGLVAALLSLVLSAGTFVLTRNSLLDQRESEAIQRTYLNARNVQSSLTNKSANANQLSAALQSVATGTGTYPIIQIPDPSGTLVNQSTNTQYGLDSIPPSLEKKVQQGQPAVMRIDISGETLLAVGIPLPSLEVAGNVGEYYELVSLSDIDQTLSVLARGLLIAMAGTTVLGVFMGWWVSRRALRPLGAIGLAAEAISGGRLDTRLEVSTDPDLEPLVGSFNHMVQALETRIDQDARFASDVSHELRSPITTLTASMSVIESRRDEFPEGPLRSAVDLMSADLARFQQLVEDLLEISRYDAGAVRLDLSEIRIVELVHAVIAAHHLKIPVDVDDDLVDATVRVDKRRLSRVIANLLDNAEKYGGSATRVEIFAAIDRLHIAVEDAGPGVPESDRSLIFGRFSRGAAAGRRSSGSEGVGLGLALVSEHVRLQGGDVWVEDRDDGLEGARFVVQLGAPIQTADPMDEELA